MKSSLSAVGLSVGAHAIVNGMELHSFTHSFNSRNLGKESFTFSIFSKTLQWLNYEEMAQLVSRLGFDGIDLTVRPNGHVLPEKVEEDLPKAFEAAKKAGLTIPMIVTSINDADNPLSEQILRTASSLGIKHYRMDWLYYDDTKSIEDNLTVIETRMKKLAVLNEKYKIRGEYQNHSGKYTPNSYFGSSIWDLYRVLKNINSPWLGSQYDIMHAFVEGAYSWETGFRLINPFIYSIAVKDFVWIKKQDKWVTELVPTGEGMVDCKKYFKLLKQYRISCPVTVHFEFPLIDSDKDEQKIAIRKEELISAMGKEIVAIRKYFNEANLIE